MSVNTIPERLVDYRVYLSGSDLLGVADVELPKIQFQTESLKGAGILGELETPTVGMTKSLKAKITFRTTTAAMVSLLDCSGHDLEFRSVAQKCDASGGRAYDANRIVIRGFPSEGELGKLDKGASGNSSIELECVYLKYVINDSTVLEIDKLNYIFKVGGTDLLSTIKTALGIV
ncbi:MAG: major tail tube protein [Firmicutes bacterium]|nr:major tail tube protein [Bacillota bacterium]